MQDSSVLRRLALAFAEGLIFGVGLKLIAGGTRPKAPAVGNGTAHLGTLAERVGRIEERLQEMERQRPGASQMNAKVLRAIVGAFKEHLAHRAEKHHRAAADAAAGKRIDTETAALREQGQARQRDVLSSLPQLVATQVAAQKSQ